MRCHHPLVGKDFPEGFSNFKDLVFCFQFIFTLVLVQGPVSESWFSVVSIPQFNENQKLLLLMYEMEEQSETPYAKFISLDPLPHLLKIRMNRFQLSLLVAYISCTQSIINIILLIKHFNNSTISDHFTHP